MKKKIGIGIVVLLLVAQFFRIDKSAPAYEQKADFFAMHSAPAAVEASFKVACYDCHSYETEYPWYTNITPVGQWVKGHINGARENVNFSTWASYSAEDQEHIIKECIEEIEEGHMPPTAYKAMHSKAKLTDEQQQAVMQWLEQL